MAKLEIVKFPNPVLKQPAEPVTVFDNDLHALLDDMAETMYAAEGIGLAANQVGVTKQAVVINVTEEKTGLIELVNPKIIETAGEISSEEGCLSIPDYRETITRKKSIVVSARTRMGKEFTMEADDLLSRCVQHEIDHLNGILFIDHLSRLKRGLFMRWFKKRGKVEEE